MRAEQQDRDRRALQALGREPGRRPPLIGNARLREADIATGQLEQHADRVAGDSKTPMYVAVDGRAASLVAVARQGARQG